MFLFDLIVCFFCWLVFQPLHKTTKTFNSSVLKALTFIAVNPIMYQSLYNTMRVRDRGGILLGSANEIKDIAESPAVGNAQNQYQI